VYRKETVALAELSVELATTEGRHHGPIHGCQPRRVESRGEVTNLPVKICNLPCYEKAAQMTVSELIDELCVMPPDATVMLFNRMDEPQHRRVESVELSTTKSDPYAEVVVLS
jgi:hypothetical protein